MSNLKLGVEVISAHDLIPKDGEGSSSPFVELLFDGQKFRTSAKEKDLNPVWNETFYFVINDPNDLPNLTLNAYVYSYNKDTQKKPFLGKVHLNGTSFVTYSEAAEMHYPLEKQHILSHVRGELGLKVFLTDDPSVRISNPLPAMESFVDSAPVNHFLHDNEDEEPNYQQVPKKEKAYRRHVFRHLPNSNSGFQQQQQQPQRQYFSGPAKSEPQAPKTVQVGGGPSVTPVDYRLKETSPFLGGGRIVGGRVIRSGRPVSSTYDLVEKMQFLFIRVVKARDLPTLDLTGSLDPYVEIKIGNYRGRTRHFEKNSNPEWNDVFAFSKDQLQSSTVEIYVKDKDFIKDDFAGLVRFDLIEVPQRVPPDSPLAPQWYRLEDKKGEKIKNGELMLAIWFGTQADEAFSEAQHSDSLAPDGLHSSLMSVHTRSKVYHSPRLWYVRVNVIEAQDLVPSEKSRIPDAYVRVVLGNQLLKTRSVQARTGHPFWNEDIMLVAAEPFEEHLILTVEDRLGPNKEETLAKLIIPLGMCPKRLDDKMVPSKWFSLQRPSSEDIQEPKKDKFASRLHLRVTLDGGYHVFDESTYYSSDLRPTARQLWKSSIGILELGILNADGLHPMKTREGKGTADTFCVAKYGQKWVRTRTIIDSLNPKYNEQYTWEVHDPSTVLSIGMFDNGHIGGSKETRIGKIRIRISTLESGRVYTHSYPLLILNQSGVKKMGELHLAIRFSCTSVVNLMNMYTKPLLPKMHYSRPLSIMQTNILRQQAIVILSNRLNRAEPPLRKEVVEYMCDVDSHFWSMRRSKANFYRIVSVFQGLIALTKWFGEICAWKNPAITVLVHLLYMMLVFLPEMIFPTAFLYMFLIGLWNYRYQPKHPPHMDIRMSWAEMVSGEDLDEEFDTFPTSKGTQLVRMRYDRLRAIGARIQSVMGDVAAQGERVQALLNWRDPRATSIFLVFCLLAAVVMYTTPFKVMALFVGLYVMRHPKFRHKLPSAPVNFFRRLPAKTDCML